MGYQNTEIRMPLIAIVALSQFSSFFFFFLLRGKLRKGLFFEATDYSALNRTARERLQNKYQHLYISKEIFYVLDTAPHVQNTGYIL